MSKFYLSEEKMKKIEKAMEKFSENGVAVAEDHSGEMNFSGCAKGYCMAWA